MCPEAAVYRGYCQAHARVKERQTNRAGQKVYRTAKWLKRRRRFLFDHPICANADCKRPATDVDHIVAIQNGGAIWAVENWQGLCAKHHGEKTRSETRC